MTLHVSVSVPTDLMNVHIQLKYLMRTYANAGVLKNLSVKVDRSSTQTLVYVSVLIRSPNALQLKSLMTLHASVSVPTDLMNVHIQIKCLMRTYANAGVLKCSNAVENRNSIQIHASASAPTNQHVALHINLIPTRVHVSASLTLALLNTTLTESPAAAYVASSTVPRAKSSTGRHVNVSVLGWKSVGHQRVSIPIRVGVSALTTTAVRLIKYLTTVNANVGVSETPGVADTTPLTTTAVTVFAIVSALIPTVWTLRGVNAYVIESVPMGTSSPTDVSAFL